MTQFFETSIDMEEEVEEIILMKDKSRAKRRKNNVYKAIRKKKISQSISLLPKEKKGLHEYSKNKIHCSCNYCKFRSKFNPNQRTYSDMKKDVSMDYKMKEYINMKDIDIDDIA